MTDYSKMRRNMLDGQIRTNGVINEAVLSAFEAVPRELFVPSHLQPAAYNDEDLETGEGRYILEPMVHSKLLQALAIAPNHVVLDIGSGLGYSASIMSLLASTVIAVVEKPEFLTLAQSHWLELGYNNIVGIAGALKAGNPEHAPYDVIYINGAVAEIPQAILNQLAVNGRLGCVLKKAGQPVGQAVIVERLSQEHFSTMVLFDASTPYLHGFKPEPAFQF